VARFYYNLTLCQGDCSLIFFVGVLKYKYEKDTGPAWHYAMVVPTDPPILI
jgi:hypothetical protein